MTIAVAATAIWSAAPATSQTTPTTLTVFDVAGPFSKEVDVIGRKGLSAGDYIVETHRVIDPDTGERPGRSVTHVQVIRATRRDGNVVDLLGIINCTIDLGDDELHFTGAVKLSEVFGEGAVVPVVGGTGAYAGTGGTVTIQASEVGDAGGSLLSFELK